MIFFSSSRVGFYDSDIHGENVPGDVVEITASEHAALLDGQSLGMRIVADVDGRPMLADPLPLTLEQLQARFTAQIQARLDSFARTRNYDGILSACTYATSTVPRFQVEGQHAVDLRDQTWAAAYEILAEVHAETRPMPESLADIEADLPELEWPQ